MRVTLAYLWRNPDTFQVHLSDSTVDVDDTTAAQLIASGNARLPDSPSGSQPAPAGDQQEARHG